MIKVWIRMLSNECRVLVCFWIWICLSLPGSSHAFSLAFTMSVRLTEASELPPEEATASAWMANVLPSLSARAASAFHLTERELGLLDFEQAPGEIVFIPRGWWHTVVTLPSKGEGDCNDQSGDIGGTSSSVTVAVTQNYMASAAFELAAHRMARGSRAALEAACAWCDRVEAGSADEMCRARARAVRDSVRALE